MRAGFGWDNGWHCSLAAPAGPGDRFALLVKPLKNRLARWPTTSLPPMLLWALGTRPAPFQQHRDPMAWEQLFADFQALGLISSKNPGELH